MHLTFNTDSTEFLKMLSPKKPIIISLFSLWFGCVALINITNSVVWANNVTNKNVETSNDISSQMAVKPKNTINKSVLGLCTRCRLLSNSIYENLKNITNNEGDKQIKVDHTFLNNIDALNQVKKKVKFSKLWNRICFNIKAGRDDCRTLAELNMDKISNWWERIEIENTDSSELSKNNLIFDQLCIDILEVCCPDGHYGPNCVQCIGFPNHICSNNGKCSGAGTRLGNGHCVCKKGYTGDDCSKCDKSFYLNRTITDETGSVQCFPCDVSCKDSCFAGGSRGCHVCKNGYAWENEYGCFDVDECEAGRPDPCPPNSFCINTEGSYMCYQCDQACDGCNGDGPDSCLKCAKDHVIKDGACVHSNPKPLFPAYEASPARYVTYLGLCLVTCIIFRHNIFVASAIGIAVAMYIMASERSLDTENGRNFDNWIQKLTWK